MRIDWQIYYDAAKKCHDLAADLRRADKPVHDAVKGECAGMAGDAPGCKEWGEKYDTAARDTMQSCTDLADALTNFGYVLYATGYNYGKNNKSNPLPDLPDVHEVSKYQVTIPTSVRNNGIGIEHHGGVQELFDALIAKIIEQFGKLPNGDIAKLAKASSTWTTFANHETVTGAASQLTTIIGLFDTIDDKTNLPPLLGHLETLRNGATQVAAAAQNLAGPVAEYHTGTVDVRANFESSITKAEWAIGLTVVAAAAAAFFTFGSSAAAGAGGVGVIVTNTVNTIRTVYQGSNLLKAVGLATAAAGAIGIIKSFDKVPDLTTTFTSLATIIAMRVLIDDDANSDSSTDSNAQPNRPTKTDKIKEHLTDRDLDAARRELNGEVVARKPDGTPWDHVHEVRDAQNGLVNRIGQIQRSLADSRTSAAERQELERELSEASRLLDYSEQFVPRN
ncbi:polymorphic toxin type 28 domain-containing protein [Nocardia colli]|uniref:polymorphic toxin type 28 domain-containing protein n=1 Tax=Nocardia colli TaxID=2545717 RepID=UPI0035D711A4